MLTFNDVGRNPQVYEESKELRTHFDIQELMSKILWKLFHALQSQRTNWTRDDLKAYASHRLARGRNMLATFDKQIHEHATVLAGIFKAKLKDRALSGFKSFSMGTLIKEYYEKYEDEYFKIIVDDIWPSLNELLKQISNTWMTRYKIKEDISNLPCRNETTSECSEMITWFHTSISVPLVIDAYGYMGFGTFLSYFSRLLASKKGNSDFLMKNGYNSKNGYNENIIIKATINALKPLNGQNNETSYDLSLFDLIKLLHSNDDESKITFAPKLQKTFDCFGKRSIMMDLKLAWDIYENDGDHPPCKNISYFMENFNKRNFSKCCQLFGLVQEYDLESVLKIMKYSIQPVVFREPLEDFLYSFQNLSFLPFNNFTKYESTNSHWGLRNFFMEQNANPRILRCGFAQRKLSMPDECNLFHNSLTNDGFGYTFNNADFWDLYNDNEYTNLFSKIMRPKGYKKEIEDQENIELSNLFSNSNNMNNWVYPNSGIIFPRKSGPRNGLQVRYCLVQKVHFFQCIQITLKFLFQIFLEGNKLYDYSSPGYKSNNPFRISVHDPMSIADLDQGASIEAGYVTTISITPSQILTSRNAKELPLDKRQCLFKEDSRKLTLFKGYTQANCLFECHLKAAYEKCACIPWDFPRLNKTWPLCDRFARECFQLDMTNAEIDDQCNCPLDCATTRYTISLHSTLIDGKTYCGKKDKYYTFLTNYTTRHPPLYISRYEEIINGYEDRNSPNSKDNMDLCINRTQNMAILKFEITDDVITKIKKTERMTFADFVSNIGRFGTNFIYSQASFT